MPFATGVPRVGKICVRRLTERTHGSANGIGMTDITTREALDAIDFLQTYPNALTSTVIESEPVVVRSGKSMYPIGRRRGGA
ncbi:hypothetical protein CVV65_06400 [Kyrpidia spormannii]|uniref:Uncharacterized protein n=1 Tax=Kyrpidia spormannii TaxID=2055160 RepID=A0A2K8N7Q1_9BACL|nr:hypothetical protein CVV65_06400 [Kyrpidia spormannii]